MRTPRTSKGRRILQDRHLEERDLTGEIAVRKDRRSKAKEKIRELTLRLDEAGAKLSFLLSNMGMDL